MRHRKSGRKFGMDKTAREAMFRNMVTSLLVHGRIKTTKERAKELRGFAERVITIGKTAPAVDGLEGEELAAAKAKRVHLIRKAKKWVHDDDALGKLFGEYADRYAQRPGGYTRVTKAGYRAGDNASMAYIELVTEGVGEKAVASDDAAVDAGAASEE